jgi:hypothetical protein
MKWGQHSADPNLLKVDSCLVTSIASSNIPIDVLISITHLVKNEIV